MQSLSPEAQARLAAFRRAESPSEADAERCLAAIEARVAAAPVVPSVSVSRGRIVIVGAAALALAAGLVLALRFAGELARDDDAAGQQAPYQEERAPVRRVEEVAPVRVTVPVAAPVSEPAPVEVAPALPLPVQAPVPGARRARVPDAADIAAEVAALREAKLAAPADRLALLAGHARRFPDGAFAAERGVLEVETRCELGEVEEARALAVKFGQRFRGSPLVARVAKICAGEPAAP